MQPRFSIWNMLKRNSKNKKRFLEGGGDKTIQHFPVYCIEDIGNPLLGVARFGSLVPNLVDHG